MKTVETKITLEHIEHSIAVLLTAYAEQRKRRVGAREIISSEFVQFSDIPIGKEGELVNLCEDPIRYALRDAIVKMANHLNEHFSEETKRQMNIGKFNESFDRIVKLSEGDKTMNEFYLDRIFDGIGGWTA